MDIDGRIFPVAAAPKKAAAAKGETPAFEQPCRSGPRPDAHAGGQKTACGLE